jgi:hypothetical protein
MLTFDKTIQHGVTLMFYGEHMCSEVYNPGDVGGLGHKNTTDQRRVLNMFAWMVTVFMGLYHAVRQWSLDQGHPVGLGFFFMPDTQLSLHMTRHVEGPDVIPSFLFVNHDVAITNCCVKVGKQLTVIYRFSFISAAHKQLPIVTDTELIVFVIVSKVGSQQLRKMANVSTCTGRSAIICRLLIGLNA